MSEAIRPMGREQAHAIARAFLPRHPFGNRYDYYYTRAKLRTDPLYPGVLTALRGDRQPLLDLGCGLGLLAHALRADGQHQPYHGVDIDAGKIARARRIAAAGGLDAVRFDVVDLAHATPSHTGSVAILDVLQYLSVDAQGAQLRRAGLLLAPGGRLVIRAALEEPGTRSRTGRITDLLAHLAGWMKARPRSYPDRARLQAQLADAGLQTRFSPLYGNTPFNNWLIVATRD